MTNGTVSGLINTMRTVGYAGALILPTMGAAAYKGYHDAQGTPIDSETANTMIKYAPAAVHSVVGGYLGLWYGICDNDRRPLIKYSASGALMGGAVGGLETAAGYAIGYTIGGLSKSNGWI